MKRRELKFLRRTFRKSYPEVRKTLVFGKQVVAVQKIKIASTPAFIDVRVLYINHDGELAFTAKGVRLQLDNFDRLLRATKRVIKES